MWFKNLIVYRLENTFEYSQEDLEAKLENQQFAHCSSQQPWSFGWTSPMGRHGSALSHYGSGAILLTARREERLLPAGVVNEMLGEKVEAIELEQDRRVGRKERQELKEELIFDMLPRAFTRSTRMQGLILPQTGLVIIDSSNRTKAEEWLTLLRQTLGSLPVKPLEVVDSTISNFTAWLSGKTPLPASLELGDQCELRSLEDAGAIVRCSQQDLAAEELQAHLTAGKVVVKLALHWGESLGFVLNDTFEIKRLRFADSIKEEAHDNGQGEAAAEFDAAFTLMALELNRFLPALVELFGGIEQPD